MNTDELIRQFQARYGPGNGMKVYFTVMPGILADFSRMLDERPGETMTEEYRLEDGKGSLILTGFKRADRTTQVDITFRG